MIFPLLKQEYFQAKEQKMRSTGKSIPDSTTVKGLKSFFEKF
jgi:hypothetical protein